ncbi:MAG: AMP-binding protein [Deltaproteobacteria bacterium]|nr:AMP-binding protein [Deltaproteobacteria bacterium]
MSAPRAAFDDARGQALPGAPPSLWAALAARAAGPEGGGPLLVGPRGATWTAAALAEAATARAAALRGGGLRPGQPVVVQAAGVDLLVDVFALWRAGAVPALLHPAVPAPAVAAWAERVGAVGAPAQGPPAADLPPLPAADAPALLLRTSGSTGPPKAALHSHGSLAWCAAGMVGTLGLRPGDRLLGALPMGFHYGFSQLSAALLCGGAVVFEDEPLPAARAALLSAGGVEVAALVPELWAQLLPLPAGPGPRALISAGGALPVGLRAALASAWPGAALHELYGATECLRSLHLPPGAQNGPGRLGVPVPGVAVAVIVEEEGGAQRFAAPDEEGELVHAGAMLALALPGAVGPPSIRPCPPLGAARALFTGDRAVRDAAGRLWHRGRRDLQWKVGGLRVGPEEVEAAVCGLPGVEGALAFAVQDVDLGLHIEVAVRLLPEAPTTAALLRAARAALPPWAAPRRLHVWTGPWPATDHGKRDRVALAAACARAPR